jgi:hypothetical protein
VVTVMDSPMTIREYWFRMFVCAEIVRNRPTMSCYGMEHLAHVRASLPRTIEAIARLQRARGSIAATAVQTVARRLRNQGLDTMPTSHNPIRRARP